MSEHFAFLGDKHKAASAVTTSFGVVLLLLLLLSPASLGFGGGAITIQEAFGQEPTPSASTFVLRGLIGSSLPAQGGDITTENNSSHIVTGRFRVFANESLVNRFVAEMDLAAIDGTAINGTTFHNITIEDTTPHRFQLTESGNGSSTTSAGGSVPPVSSNIMTRIYLDSNAPIVDNVPMTISIRGQVLAIEGIDIDETTITDTGQREILGLIDGQSIYGIVAR
jgi:hypothetical protein